jgi:hypothetical protein
MPHVETEQDKVVAKRSRFDAFFQLVRGQKRQYPLLRARSGVSGKKDMYSGDPLGGYTSM